MIKDISDYEKMKLNFDGTIFSSAIAISGQTAPCNSEQIVRLLVEIYLLVLIITIRARIVVARRRIT